MNKKLHVVSFTVEVDGEEGTGKQDDEGGDGGDDDHKGEDEEADDLFDTDDDGAPPKEDHSANHNSSMKTPANKPSSNTGCKTVIIWGNFADF